MRQAARRAPRRLGNSSAQSRDVAGLTWTVSPSLALDGAIRVGRQDEALEGHVNLLELRLGLTGSFPVFRHDEREP